MSISGISSSLNSYDMQIKPQKPNAPTPPPGGNIENRQPPAEPQKPAEKPQSSKENVGGLLDIKG